MAWWYIVLAGIGEIAWAIGLKYSQGFSRLWPSVWTILAFIISMLFLSLAMRTLPVGSAYAVWTGIGVVGTAVLGMVLFDEPRDVLRLLCIGLIVAGIIGLKVLSPST